MPPHIAYINYTKKLRIFNIRIFFAECTSQYISGATHWIRSQIAKHSHMASWLKHRKLLIHASIFLGNDHEGRPLIFRS